MNGESFEKLDEAWMKKLKTSREKEVPSKILEGFSDSVEERIRREREEKSFRPNPFRLWAPVWVPAFAALLVFFGWLASGPLPFGTKIPSVPVASIQLALSATSEITEEIAALRELGVWTEEDDEALNGSLEDLIPEIV